MKKPNLLSTSALWSAALLSITLATTPAFAQDTADAAAEGDEEIIITGSRIPRLNDFTAANPITSVSGESIEQSGQTNLVEYLQGIPALTGSLDAGQTTGSAGFIGSTGLNLLNLRNLGVARTLVLVDGRRHVAALPETSAIDIGTIPVDLIDRVEVVTGGAGAVYGADAVSGVVNFIMKKNFEGIVGRAQAGAGTDGSPGDWHGSIAAGTNFGADDRGNIAFSFSADLQGRLRAADRSYLRGGRYRTMQQNLADPFDDPNIPDEVPLTNVAFFDSSREGGLDVDFDGVPDLRPNGQPYVVGTFIPPFYSVGGTGTLRSDYIGDVRAKNHLYVGDLMLNYKFSDTFQFFGDVKYARGHAFSASQPTFDYYILIPEDNAFLPASILAAAQGNGAPILLNRDNFDLGVRGEDIKRNTWRSVAGFRGDLTSTIAYEISYVFGQTKVKALSTNNRFNDRLFAALDAVVAPNGQIVCRSNLNPADLPFQPFASSGFNAAQLSFTPGANSGCQPLNLFGEGVASPAAIDWVMTDSLTTSKLQQHVVSGFVQGTVPGLNLWGDDIGFVVGGEWRKEKSKSDPPLEDQLGQTFGNVILPTDGNFSVKEAFAEVRVPIFKDKPFAETLELNGAVRFSDYTTVGSTFSWNTSAKWAPVRDITFRGTYAKAVRAPNISELFSPQSQTFLFIDDPCDISQLNNGSSTRAANCSTLLTGLGVNPATFTDPNSSSIPGVQIGNPDLSEETAKSWTAGVVIEPRFIPGLHISLDWYNIKIANAINTPTAEEVAELCVDAPDLNNVFCDAITREFGTAAITDFSIQPANVASFRTVGLDFQLDYRLDPADLGIGSNLGLFNIRLMGNYLDKLTFISVPGAELDDDRTEQFAPKWQVTLDVTWRLDPITVNYGFNYFSKTTRYSLEDLAGDPDLASKANIFYNARHTHDIQINWDIEKKASFYIGMNNIFNQKPDIATFYPVSPVGRFVYAGFKVNFDNPFDR